MRTHLVATCMAVLWVLASVASAGGTETLYMGAHVVAVDAKNQQATLDHGKLAGLKLGDIGALFPTIKSEDSKTPTVEFGIRVARGKIVKLEDNRAVVSLDAIAGTLEVGAYFEYELTVSSEVTRSPLVRTTARGIEFLANDGQTPFVTIEALLADRSGALADKTIDAMMTAIKDPYLRQFIVNLKDPIPTGRHRGKLALDLVDSLDRAQVVEFLNFVDAFPGKYVGRRWKVAEVYVTWLISGTPSGEQAYQLRVASATLEAARKAAETGKLDESRAHWRTVLATVPDYKEATDALARIDKIVVLQRRLAGDPDDTATRYELMDALFQAGAYTAALTHQAPLKKAKYEPLKVERLRAWIYGRQQKWAESAEVLKGLVKAYPDDKELATGLKRTRGNAKRAKKTADAGSLMELALIAQEEKRWDDALSHYRALLELPRATAAQREAATLAQPRIATQRRLDQFVVWAHDHVRGHDLLKARERVASALRNTDKLSDADQAATLLSRVADTAREVFEDDFAAELLTEAVKRAPSQLRAHTDLAWTLVSLGSMDAASAMATKAMTLKGATTYVAQLVLSYAAQDKNELAESETQALLSSKTPRYSPAHRQLARLAASAGRWEDAMEHASKALAIDDGWHSQTTHRAVSRGQLAHEALQANATSARDRLKLIRAFAQLGLTKRVTEEIAKLPADGTWRSDAWWALAISYDDRIQLADRLIAARNTQPTSEHRKKRLALIEAQTRVRAKPNDEDQRIALARLYVELEDSHRALGVLGPIMASKTRGPAVGALVRDIRQALTLADEMVVAEAALAREDWTGTLRLTMPIQEHRDRLGMTDGRLRARLLRINALAGLGKYQDAIALAEEARAIAVAYGAPSWTLLVNQRVGSLRSAIGTNEAHRIAVADALKTCEELDDEPCLYDAHSGSVSLALQDGRAAEAIEHAGKAWTLANQLGVRALGRMASADAANAHLIAGEYARTEEIALKLLTESRKASDIDRENYALMLLGASATSRGQGKVARARFAESYEVGARAGRTDWRANAREHEGRAALFADHDPAAAARALEQAAALYASLGEGWGNEARGSVLRTLALAHLKAGNLAKARKAAEEGITIAKRFQRRLGLVWSNWLLARIAIEDNKADDAMTHATETVALAGQTDNAALLANAWHVLARANAMKGKDQPAREAFEKSLAQLDRVMRAAGGDADRSGVMNAGDTRLIYKDAVAHLMKIGEAKRGMEVLALLRDAELNSTFDPTSVETTDPKAKAGLDGFKKKRAEKAALQKQRETEMDRPAAQRSPEKLKALTEQIAKTEAEMSAIVLGFQVTHPDLYNALAVAPDTLMEHRKELPAGSVAIQYFIADDMLYAFVISAALTQPSVVRIQVTSAELAGTIVDFREAIIQENEKIKDRDQVEKLGRKLDDWLLEPLRAHIDGASTLIIMPFGSLYYLPFDALVVSDPGQPVRYAIEDFRISIQSKSTLDHLLRALPAPRTGSLLAVSNPDGSLDFAQKEVRRIVKTLPNARVLGKGEATRAKFKEMVAGFRFVHIATHGKVETEPRNSYLKLSDGNLTISDIRALKMRDTNEMVVLSACESATERVPGKVIGEQISLAVAFAKAGAPTLVASLWEVGDISTSELMMTFYRAFESGKGDRLDALRNAKLNLLRFKQGNSTPFREPWHWASFQLLGDFRTPVAK